MEIIKEDKVADYILVLTFDIHDYSDIKKIFYINTNELNDYLISLSILRKYYEQDLYFDPISIIIEDVDINLENINKIIDILSYFSVWYYNSDFAESEKAEFCGWQLLDSNLNNVDYNLDGKEMVIVNTIVDKIKQYVEEL